MHINLLKLLISPKIISKNFSSPTMTWKFSVLSKRILYFYLWFNKISVSPLINPKQVVLPSPDHLHSLGFWTRFCLGINHITLLFTCCALAFFTFSAFYCTFWRDLHQLEFEQQKSSEKVAKKAGTETEGKHIWRSWCKSSSGWLFFFMQCKWTRSNALLKAKTCNS